MKLIQSLLPLALAFPLVACGASPLLNHVHASSSHSLQDQTTVAGACALELKTEKLCASFTWSKQPTEDSKGVATVRFWKKDEGTEAGPYVSPSHSVFVKLWMPSMGHGSSPVTTKVITESDGSPIPGVYEASEIYFVMGGKWEIRLQLRDGTRVLDQAILPYEVRN